MGWASGSGIMNEAIDVLKKHVPDNEIRQKIYEALILAFEADDWDTQDECLGRDKAFDAAIKKLKPHWEID